MLDKCLKLSKLLMNAKKLSKTGQLLLLEIKFDKLHGFPKFENLPIVIHK